MTQSPEWLGESIDPTAVSTLPELLDTLVVSGIPRIEAREKGKGIYPDQKPDDGCWWCLDPEWDGDCPPVVTIHLHHIYGVSIEIDPDNKLGQCSLWLSEHDEGVAQLRYWPGLSCLRDLMGSLADCWWDRNKESASG